MFIVAPLCEKGDAEGSVEAKPGRLQGRSDAALAVLRLLVQRAQLIERRPWGSLRLILKSPSDARDEDSYHTAKWA